MLSREEVRGRLEERLDKQYAKVEKDNKWKSTPARVAKLNVLEYLKRYLADERDTTLVQLQDIVRHNALYDATSGFFKSATEVLLHDIIRFREGEAKEQSFMFKFR